MASNTYTAVLKVDSSGAVAALKRVEAAARAVQTAGGGSKAVGSINGLTKQVKELADAYRAVGKAAAESGAKEIKAANDARNARLAADNDRKLKRATSANNDAINTAKGASVIDLNGERGATERGKQARLEAQKYNEELRSQIMLQNAAGVAAERTQRMQIASAREAQRAANQQNEGLSQLRYALYDVSRTALVTGLALSAAFIAPLAAAVTIERQFANVQRTVGGNSTEVKALREDFLGLAAAIPESFEDLTKIGTLAGQIGIASTSVTEFTGVVAKFSTTTGVSVDESATAFGRLNSLIPDVKSNFTGLADSVLSVGVNSVATEQQILKIATQISSLTAAAGFGYQATIGLSGALASVGVPPELARGVVTRVFGTISRAIGEGGANLERFGKMAGLSGADFKAAWNNDAAATFQRVMNGIKENGAGAEQAIRDIGITSVRDVPILLRLANAYDSAGHAGGLLKQTMDDAANGAGELNSQYAIIADTIAAKIQVLVNNVNLLFNSVGQGGLGPLGDVLDFLTKKLQELTAFLSTDAGQGIAAFGFAVTALGAVLAITTAVASKGITSYVALIQVFEGLAASSLKATGTQSALAAAMTAAGVSAKVATPLVKTLSAAISILGVAVVGLGVATLAQGLADAAEESSGAAASFEETADALADMKNQTAVIDTLGRAGNVFAQWDNTNITDVSNALKKLADDEEGFEREINSGWNGSNRINQNLKDFKGGIDILVADGKIEEAAARIKTFKTMFELSDAEVTSLLGKSLDGMAEGAKGAADALAQLTPEEQAAEQATRDFLDVIAGGDASFVNINAAYQSQIDGAQKAAQKQADATDDMSDSWQTYFDGFSVNITAYLDELDRMIGAQSNWEQNLTTLRLSGLSDDALAELSKLGVEGAPLVQAFADDLAANGKGAIDRFNAAIEEGSTGASTAFATMLNNLSPAVQGAFAGLGTDAVAEISRKLQEGGYTLAGIVAEYNLDIPAEVIAEVDGRSVEEAQATLDYAAQLREAGMEVKVLPDPYNTAIQTLDIAAKARQADINTAVQGVSSAISTLTGVAAPRTAPVNAQAFTAQPEVDLSWLARDRTANINVAVNAVKTVADAVGSLVGPSQGGEIPQYLATGGAAKYRGMFGAPRGTDTVPAMLTPGEYVIRAKAAAALGPSLLASLNRADSYGNASNLVQGASYGRSSSSNASFPTSIMAELSPTDRQWLARIANAVGITIAPSDLAAATNASNLSAFQKGSN